MSYDLSGHLCNYLAIKLLQVFMVLMYEYELSV